MTDGMNAIDLIGLWTNFLPIANLLFAVVFVIVIYSTATGQGLTNYSIKKILPRLIIVAVGVNVSFYLCAILADLINIVAVGIPDLIFTPVWQESVDGMSGAVSEIQGVIGGIFGVVLVFLMGMVAVVALLVTVIALVARQLILSMLVVISPLAVVCAVLPSTQKWFEKWAKAYIQLLAVYPMFMLVWAGVRWFQIVGIEELMNTTTFGTIIGFLVRCVAPIIPAVAIYPLLKMSGGVMGKLTGAIDKSPLGTQGALGKKAGETDARRRESFASGRYGGPLTNNRLVNSLRSRGKMTDAANKEARQASDAEYEARQSGIGADGQYDENNVSRLGRSRAKSSVRAENASSKVEAAKQGYRAGAGSEVVEETMAQQQAAAAHQRRQQENFARSLQEVDGVHSRNANIAGAGYDGGARRAQMLGSSILDKQNRELVDQFKQAALTQYGNNRNALLGALGENNLSEQEYQAVAELLDSAPGGTSGLVSYAQNAANLGAVGGAKHTAIRRVMRDSAKVGAKNPLASAWASDITHNGDARYNQATFIATPEGRAALDDPKVTDAVAWSNGLVDAVRADVTNRGNVAVPSGVNEEFIDRMLASEAASGMDDPTRESWNSLRAQLAFVGPMPPPAP